MDLIIGNFRISYRDWRFHYSDDMLSPRYRELGVQWLHQIMCPAMRKNETINISKVEKFAASPDVIVSENPEVLRMQSPGCVEHYEEEGGLFIGISFKPRNSEYPEAPSYDKDLYGSIFSNIEMSNKYEADRKPYIDVTHMARPLWNDDRSSFSGNDIHYVHTGSCHQLKNPNGSAVVCSDVMEMEVFMVLHTVKQRRPNILSQLECEVNTDRQRSVKICEQCPKDLGSYPTDPITCSNFTSS